MIREAKGALSGGRLQFIGVQGKVRSGEPGTIARAGDSLSVLSIPDEVVGGVSVQQSARILYSLVRVCIIDVACPIQFIG